MRKLLLSLSIVLLLMGCSKNDTRKGFQVGVIQFGDFASLNDTLGGLEEVLGDKVNLSVKSAQGDAANVVGIATQFVDDEVDLIVAITTQSAQAAVAASDGEIPVVFAAVSDPLSAGLTDLEYVTGVSDIAPLQAQFDLMKDLTPSVKKVGVLFKTGDPNGVYQTERVKEVGSQNGFEVIEKGAMEVADLSISASQLSEQVDAFYLITDGLIVGNTGVIVDEATRNGKVTYASEDGQFEQGVLASNSISYLELGKQAGVLAEKILFDAIKPGTLPIESANKTTPQISQSVAESFGIEIPEDYLEYLLD